MKRVIAAASILVLALGLAACDRSMARSTEQNMAESTARSEDPDTSENTAKDAPAQTGPSGILACPGRRFL